MPPNPSGAWRSREFARTRPGRRIEIRDNGIGIPEPALATIFHRFTRAHSERDDLLHVTGIGLGLAIVEDCVRGMNGRIEVSSVEGEGTAFVLRLPKHCRS